MSDATGPTPDDAQPPASRRMVGGRNLPLAIGVGVVLVVVFLGTLFWHPLAFSAVVAGLTIVGHLEVGRVLAGIGLRVDVGVALMATLVMLVGASVAGPSGQAVGVVVLLVGAVLARLFDSQRTDVVRTLASTLLFGLWIGFLGSYAVLLVDRPDGIVVVLAVVATAILTDVGGYAFGVTIGRHKIAPSISPNKTWEGFLGGVALSIIVAALVLPMFGDTFTWLTAAVIGGVCGVASFVGDLTESMVKRDLGLKDLGDVLPGHGGVLDRVDGILFALPVGYYVLAVLP